jgi:hypothetical protein
MIGNNYGTKQKANLEFKSATFDDFDFFFELSNFNFVPNLHFETLDISNSHRQGESKFPWKIRSAKFASK